jgi:2-haloacid dehalogenase/putative hydrolase of the HAD superfamily
MSAPAAARAYGAEQPEGRPKAVLFDIGNVVVGWSPRALYSKLICDPAALDHFLAEVCPMRWHAETDRGLSFADNIARRIALYPDHADLIRAWQDRWAEMFTGPIPETEAAIEALHARGVPMHGLTNMAVESWPAVRAMSPAFERLDVVVVSGAEGVIKPDPAIYEIACARTGLRPRDMLFVDDSLANVEAARALGFHVHHFTDPAALRPQLAAFGLL